MSLATEKLCFQCGLAFANNNVLKIHTSLVHSKNTPEKMQISEKTVALYRHYYDQNITFIMDPETQELSAPPSDRLVKFVNEQAPYSTIHQIVRSGLFVKVCDCKVQFKKSA